MHLFGILVLLTIVIAGGIVQQHKSGEVQSSATEISPTALPTAVPTIIITPLELQSFRYPGTMIVLSDASSIELTSRDNTDTITDWYKSAIKSSNMNTTAFAVTKTNGNIRTKLVGSGGGKKVKIEISKKSNEHITKIILTYSTY